MHDVTRLSVTVKCSEKPASVKTAVPLAADACYHQTNQPLSPSVLMLLYTRAQTLFPALVEVYGKLNGMCRLGDRRELVPAEEQFRFQLQPGVLRLQGRPTNSRVLHTTVKKTTFSHPVVVTAVDSCAFLLVPLVPHHSLSMACVADPIENSIRTCARTADHLFGAHMTKARGLFEVFYAHRQRDGVQRRQHGVIAFSRAAMPKRNDKTTAALQEGTALQHQQRIPERVISSRRSWPPRPLFLYAVPFGGHGLSGSVCDWCTLSHRQGTTSPLLQSNRSCRVMCDLPPTG